MGRILEKGIYIQPYMDVIPGKNISERQTYSAKKLDEFKTLGVKGICWHGFVGGLDRSKFESWAQIGKDRGMSTLAAFGLNSKDPIQKGRWIGQVAQSDKCDGILFDMEGAWEDEADDKTKATQMGNEYRNLAPNMLTIDQPWFAPSVHWAMFPWEETARFVDVRAPQAYVMNFTRQHGKQAYEKIWEWYERDWKKPDERLAKKNLVKPRIPTIQGYNWNSIEDLVHCLTHNETVIVWAEPYPDDTFMPGLRIVNALKKTLDDGKATVKKSIEEIPITQDFPQMLTEDPKAQADVLEIHKRLGLASTGTLSVRAGYNWGKEKFKIQKEREEDPTLDPNYALKLQTEEVQKAKAEEIKKTKNTDSKVKKSKPSKGDKNV
jgi:hypothetical protein